MGKFVENHRKLGINLIKIDINKGAQNRLKINLKMHKIWKLT